MKTQNLRQQFLLTEAAEIEFSTVMDQSIETIYSLNLGQDQTLSEDLLLIENRQFIETLFDQEDHLCICKTPFKFKFKSRDSMGEYLGRYISINASNPNTSTRRSSDVTKFRNFLIEFDEMEPTEQLSKMESLNIPFSTVTFSGNKSLHFVISLENPVESLEEYQLLSNWIHNIVNKFVGHADKSTKPPSFTTRYPNVINESGIYSQKLVKLNSRISDEVFFGWLKDYIDLKPNIDGSKIDFKKKISNAVDFYVQEILKTTLEDTEWLDCPLCVEEGASNTKRMKINKDTKSIKCYCSKEHDQDIVKELFRIQREHGGENE